MARQSASHALPLGYRSTSTHWSQGPAPLAGGPLLPPTQRTPGPPGAPPGQVHFATAGEKGAIKLWRSDTGACVYEVPPEVGVAGSAAAECTDLALMPGGGGLLAATADARLLFYQPKVWRGCAVCFGGWGCVPPPVCVSLSLLLVWGGVRGGRCGEVKGTGRRCV